MTLNGGTINDSGAESRRADPAGPGLGQLALGEQHRHRHHGALRHRRDVDDGRRHLRRGLGDRDHGGLEQAGGRDRGAAAALNSGGTASYSGGSGTGTLTFTYTVAAGQDSPKLDYTSTGALTLNGGTISDTATNPNAANLTLAEPGSAGSLGGTKSIAIDTTAPAVTGVTSTTADGTYGVGSVIAITVGWSKPVVVTGRRCWR